MSASYSHTEPGKSRFEQEMRRRREARDYRDRLERFMAPIVANLWVTRDQAFLGEMVEDAIRLSEVSMKAVDEHMRFRRLDLIARELRGESNEPRRAPDATEEVKAPAIPPIA